MTILSAHSYPMKLFKDTPGAVAWLSTQLRQRGVVADVDHIAHAIADFRARYLTLGVRVAEEAS
ncbi:MAG: hypothetical protein JJ863_02815 [Deltaproteobacteria bacterium]|nr:hypothetical protein [Deltaproteobacteria bacterium]